MMQPISSAKPGAASAPGHLSSAPFVIAGYGWLYTSDLFRGSDAHPERAALSALFLVALCTTVFLLHGLLMAWAEERAGEAAEAQCPIAPAALAHASTPRRPELVE